MKLFIHLKAFCITSILGMSGQFALAQADSTLEKYSLKELLDLKVTTASKTSQKLETAPATVAVVTREQIRTRGYQSLLDVLYDLPDMKIDDKIYSGIRNSFTLRGTQGSEKMVILLNGISISSPSGEAMPIMENYPVHLAEQIEIVYGPGSALYGANAVSCVVNIITRKMPAHKDMIIDVSTLAGSYGYTNTSLYLLRKLNQRTFLTITGQYAYDNGVDYSKLYKDDSLYNIASYPGGTLNTIFGPSTPSKSIRPVYEAPLQSYNIYAALTIDDFTFSVFRNSFKVPNAYGNNTSNAVYNKDAFSAQNITTANATYKRVFDKFTSTTLLTASQYNMNPHSNYRNLYTGMEPGYKYSTCSMLKAEEQIDYKPSEMVSITGGISFEEYSAVPQSGDLDAPVNKHDYLHASYLGTKAYYRPGGLTAQFYLIRYSNVGSYLQTQYSPSNKFYLTLGARYDINSRYGSTFNPRMGVVIKPSDKTVIKALYGTAFLAPSPADSYSHYGSFDTPDSGRTYHSYFLHLPNPGLLPITSQNVELSVRQNLTDNLLLTLNAYATFITGLHEFSNDNEITRLYNNSFNGIPVDYIEVFTNNNRQKNYGGSIQLNGKYEIGRAQINWFATASYVEGVLEKGLKEIEEVEKDTELDFISPFMFHLGIDMKNRKFSFAPRVIIAGKQHLSGLADTTGRINRRQTIPGYALLNLSLRYAVSKRVSVFTNISNALNQHYKNVGFNMDLTNMNTELLQGQRQDPIRIMSGINFSL